MFVWEEFSVTSQSTLSDLLPDWTDRPRLQTAIAVLFTGCIVVNFKTHNAILTNSNESYGRGHKNDVHTELPGVNTGGPFEHSQPSGLRFYPGLRPIIFNYDVDDKRLVLGLKYSSILITSILQLTSSVPTSDVFVAGNCAARFPIPEDLSLTRIFLEKGSIQRALDIASGRYSPPFEVVNLRQVRSKFDSLHTYAMARASWTFIENMTNGIPTTLFTLNFHTSEVHQLHQSVSSLFQHIAFQVHHFKRESTLEKSKILETIDNISSASQSTFDGVLKLFFEGAVAIKIIGNKDLNGQLKTLAGVISNQSYASDKETVVCNLQVEYNKVCDYTKVFDQ